MRNIIMETRKTSVIMMEKTTDCEEMVSNKTNSVEKASNETNTVNEEKVSELERIIVTGDNGSTDNQETAEGYIEEELGNVEQSGLPSKKYLDQMIGLITTIITYSTTAVSLLQLRL
jgi:hypothetical protein